MLGPKPERLRRVARRTKAAPRATTRSGTHEGALSFCFFQSQTRRDQDVASFRQDLGSATSYIHWTPTTGACAGFERLVLETRRDDCTNWCQQVAEWLETDIDEEIRVLPKRQHHWFWAGPPAACINSSKASGWK